MSGDWRDLAPADLLERSVVLTTTQVAYVLDLVHFKGKHAGQPDRTAVIKLVKDGRLHVIDREQPPWRWRVSPAEIYRYIHANGS